MLDTLWSTIGDKFQIGLDIFTALSVIFAAGHYIRSSKEQAKKLRQERLSESGGQILTEQIDRLSSNYMDFVNEAQDVEQRLRVIQHQKSTGESEEDFISRCTKHLEQEYWTSSLNEEIAEFIVCYTQTRSLLFSQKYVICPILDAMANNRDKESLSQKFNEACSNSIALYDDISAGFYSLLKEFVNVRVAISKLDKNISYEEFFQDISSNEEYAKILAQLHSILNDKYYIPYIREFIYREDELSEKKRESLEGISLDLLNIAYLFELFRSDKWFSSLAHNIATTALINIQKSRYEIKSILCLYSACYSYILYTEAESKGKTLQDEIDYYEKLFDLEGTIR